MIDQTELGQRANRIKAVLFDWDGVFNDGWKDPEDGSALNGRGVDSMVVNKLRFARRMGGEGRIHGWVHGRS